MKLQKKNIGVLDLNIDNIYFLNALRNRFKNDDIYYVNDLTIENIDEMEIDEINKKINELINYLMIKKIDILVVISDNIVEYCEDLLNNLSVPVVQIVNETINFINEEYEYKNIGFLSTTSMINANIYQKNFRYNHLYNMNGDNLKQLIKEHLVKTTESFQEAKNIIAPVFKKDLDIIVPSLMNYLMVCTEINEFLKDVSILKIDDLLCDCIEKYLYKFKDLPQKGRGKTYLCVNKEVDEYQLKRLLKIKYKLIDRNTEVKE